MFRKHLMMAVVLAAFAGSDALASCGYGTDARFEGERE